MKATTRHAKRKLDQNSDVTQPGIGRFRAEPVEDPVPLSNGNSNGSQMEGLCGNLREFEVLHSTSVFQLGRANKQTRLRSARRPSINHSRFFALRGGSSQLTQQDEVDGESVERNVWGMVPEHAQPSYWHRHQFHPDDIKHTFEGIGVVVLWRLLLQAHDGQLDFPEQEAGSQLAEAAGRKLVFVKNVGRACSDLVGAIGFDNAAKSQVVDQLVKLVHARVSQSVWQQWNRRPRATWAMCKDGEVNGDGRKYTPLDAITPVVPVHRVSAPALQHLLSAVACASAFLSPLASAQLQSMDVSEREGPSQGETKWRVPTIWQWRGILAVVSEVYPSLEAVRLVRVLPLANYLNLFCPLPLSSAAAATVAPDNAQQMRWLKDAQSSGLVRLFSAPQGLFAEMAETWIFHAHPYTASLARFRPGQASPASTPTSPASSLSPSLSLSPSQPDAVPKKQRLSRNTNRFGVVDVDVDVDVDVAVASTDAPQLNAQSRLRKQAAPRDNRLKANAKAKAKGKTKPKAKQKSTALLRSKVKSQK